MKDFFSTFLQSIWSKQGYQQSGFVSEPKGESFKYFYSLVFALALISTVITSFQIVPLIREFTSESLRSFTREFPNELEVRIQKGIATTNVREPYAVPLVPATTTKIIRDGKTDIINSFAIDTKITTDVLSMRKFESYRTYFLLTKDSTEREKLEMAFKRDLKGRIDETSKYVKPSENTMEFAFMFIPHEAIYYDLLVSQVGAVKVNTRDLIEYAFKEKHVIIVSPTSFLAYLQTVLQGLKALQIEESAKEIRNRVEDLGKHLKAYDEYMLKLGNSLGTAVNQYNFAQKEFKKVDKDVLRITGQPVGVSQLVIEKPEKELVE